MIGRRGEGPGDLAVQRLEPQGGGGQAGRAAQGDPAVRGGVAGDRVLFIGGDQGLPAASENQLARPGDRAAVLPLRLRHPRLGELLGPGDSGRHRGHAARGGALGEPSRRDAVFKRRVRHT